MARNPSGHSISEADIPTILGMYARGDRDHDVAAWFGVNQGRVAEAHSGKWGSPAAAAADSLPPKGPPGIKGRRLRSAVQGALGQMETDPNAAREALLLAMADYDANEA